MTPATHCTVVRDGQDVARADASRRHCGSPRRCSPPAAAAAARCAVAIGSPSSARAAGISIRRSCTQLPAGMSRCRAADHHVVAPHRIARGEVTSATLWPCGTLSRSTSPSANCVPAGRPPSLATMATLSRCVHADEQRFADRRRSRPCSTLRGRRSICGDLARFDHLLPARELGGLEGGELLGRVAHDLEALRQQLVLHAPGRSGRRPAGMQLRLDVGRQALGRGERPATSTPSTPLTPSSSIVGTSGSSGERFGARDGERAQLAGLDVLDAAVDVHEGRVDLGAEQVVHRRGAALVGHVHAAGAGLLPEQLGREVVATCRCRPRRSVILPGFALMKASRSAKVLYGELAGTASTLGACTATVMESKSFSASYCTLLTGAAPITNGPSDETKIV